MRLGRRDVWASPSSLPLFTMLRYISAAASRPIPSRRRKEGDSRESTIVADEISRRGAWKDDARDDVSIINSKGRYFDGARQRDGTRVAVEERERERERETR